ncbi:zinc ribbon domain-containing protein [Pleurocapsa sp. PCC 7319]|uniref:zinc ribbon domain-containing protein n=1 Tax=Pleurocapsa sp. PCC 7319 TaxID=118161 RepID=UPI00034C96F0
MPVVQGNNKVRITALLLGNGLNHRSYLALTKVFCSQCGAEAKPGDRFCRSCGQDLSQ